MTAGAALARLHARHGVELRPDTAVSRFWAAIESPDFGWRRIATAADLVVVGIGAIPETDWLAGSGLT